MHSYCADHGSHEAQLACDFLRPIGTEVPAARAGVVRDLRADIGDYDRASLLNWLMAEHEDGTTAFHAHLTRDGALVELGEETAVGQVFVLRGASSRTHPSGCSSSGSIAPGRPAERRTRRQLLQRRRRARCRRRIAGGSVRRGRDRLRGRGR